jgi:hypothetical protein
VRCGDGIQNTPIRGGAPCASTGKRPLLRQQRPAAQAALYKKKDPGRLSAGIFALLSAPLPAATNYRQCRWWWRMRNDDDEQLPPPDAAICASIGKLTLMSSWLWLPLIFGVCETFMGSAASMAG